MNALRLAVTVAVVLVSFAFVTNENVRASGMTAVPAAGTSPAIPLYVARPRGVGPFPAVVVLHGCEGFNGVYAVVADRLAARGYVAVALDSVGIGESACGGGRSGTADEARDARRTLAWLRAQSFVVPNKLALLGFSMGGIAILDIVDPEASSTPTEKLPDGLRAAIAYYPDCRERAATLALPLAIFDGDADTVTPAAPCKAMIDAANALGKTAQITTYPGATHGFIVHAPDHTFFGQPIRYDASATEDAAGKAATFLQTFLGS